MSASFEVQLEGLEQIQEFFDKAPDHTRSELGKALLKSAILTERYAKEESPIDNGPLRASIEYVQTSDQVIVRPGLKYALWVHEGTPPHRVGWEGIQALEAWAVRKGMSPAAGYAIAWKIRQQGTKGNPFMARAAKRAFPELQGFFDQAVDNIAWGLDG